MKTQKITQTIGNLSSFLKSTDLKNFIIVSGRVDGGWHDIEFTANAAGFNVYRFVPDGEFLEHYQFVRRAGSSK